MVASGQTTETPITLRLTQRAHDRLAEQAARSGQDLSTVASDLIEHAVTRPSIDDIMGTVHKQVAQSGMTELEIDELIHGELDAHRREQKAKRS